MMSVDKKHIQRVTDEKATELFHEGWRFVPKSVWKEKVRDINKTKETESPSTKKTKKTKKSKK
jgi:hypothetical protein|tara:strand:+ start:369 stop:557 length:189 start_codon:yes stop_codon:yes gene_type:complete